MSNKTKIYVIPKDDSPKEKAKAWLKNRKTDIQCFWEDNKDDIIRLTPIVIGGVVATTKVVGKAISHRNEKWTKERSIWDPKQQHWWILMKKPTPAQWAEIDRRKNNGENVADILRSLGMLKD